MTCFTAKRKSTPYVDGRLRDRERSRVDEHLLGCDPCGSYFDQLRSLRSGLRSLSVPAAPANLATKLRVIASREQQVLTESHGSRLEFLWNKWKLRLDELMRPLTIPATGGLLSSLFLFGTLGFAIGTSTRIVNYQMPVVAERADANLVPISVTSSVLLNISLDSRGRIQDYMIREASNSYTGDPARLVSNNIEMPKFPSRALGGDISILLTPVVFRQ
ncbi:MAG: zf-HC2 domain-containing protein [Acidobacteriota bacterium]|nr:zf-HC2 domain-containing protein [Acidobacteriota bacterium]